MPVSTSGFFPQFKNARHLRPIPRSQRGHFRVNFSQISKISEVNFHSRPRGPLLQLPKNSSIFTFPIFGPCSCPEILYFDVPRLLGGNFNFLRPEKLGKNRIVGCHVRKICTLTCRDYLVATSTFFEPKNWGKIASLGTAFLMHLARSCSFYCAVINELYFLFFLKVLMYHATELWHGRVWTMKRRCHCSSPHPPLMLHSRFREPWPTSRYFLIALAEPTERR